MVKIGAAQSYGDVVRLIYEAGFHQVKAATENVEQQINQHGPQIILPRH